jgi:hypothetical protein
VVAYCTNRSVLINALFTSTYVTGIVGEGLGPLEGDEPAGLAAGRVEAEEKDPMYDYSTTFGI